MPKNFWQKLKRPIFALAPMADVTDAAFRELIAKHAKPDIFFTEFTSADGLASPGKKKLLHNLKYSKKEHPIVAQLFSAKPEKMYEAAKLIRKLGFDGLDINMGCPDRAVCKQGAGGALIKTPRLAREIINAAKEGSSGLPVSVKTRIGYSKNELAQWLPAILETKPSAVTIHARTVKELSLVPARWEHVREAVNIRDRIGSDALILGNGDVTDLDDARKKAKDSGADGVLLGRAIYGNPWLFDKNSKEKNNKETEEQTIERKIKTMVVHAKLFEKHFKGIKNFNVMKRHFKAYINGFEGAKELRIEFMNTESAREVERIAKRYLALI